MIYRSGLKAILATTAATAAIGLASPGVAAQSAAEAQPSLVIRGGTIYDGSGRAPYKGDVLISGDRIVQVVKGRYPGRGAQEIDGFMPPAARTMSCWSASRITTSRNIPARPWPKSPR